MTLFDTIKPSIDVICNDLSVEDFAHILSDGLQDRNCYEYCKIEDFCNHEMGYDDDNDVNTDVTCKDVILKYLMQEVPEKPQSECYKCEKLEVKRDMEANRIIFVCHGTKARRGRKLPWSWQFWSGNKFTDEDVSKAKQELKGTVRPNWCPIQK